MNKINAEIAILKATEINNLLNNLIIKIIENKANEEEQKFYKRAVGNIMGEMYDRLLQPIFEEHPDLIPNGLR